MKCQYCHQNEATSVIKHQLNSTSYVLHICESCAGSMFFSNFFSDFPIGSILNNGQLPRTSTKTCPSCGMSLENVMHVGKVGCSTCYELFSCELARSIQKIHGKSNHMGKIPRSASGKLQQKNLLAGLRHELESLIATQEFEQAAKVRDQIRAIESQSESSSTHSIEGGDQHE